MKNPIMRLFLTLLLSIAILLSCCFAEEIDAPVDHPPAPAGEIDAPAEESTAPADDHAAPDGEEELPADVDGTSADNEEASVDEESLSEVFECSVVPAVLQNNGEIHEGDAEETATEHDVPGTKEDTVTGYDVPETEEETVSDYEVYGNGAAVITYMPNGGIGSAFEESCTGSSFLLSDCPFEAPEGMVFIGWQVPDVGLKQPGEEINLSAAALQVDAQWADPWSNLQSMINDAENGSIITLQWDCTASASHTALEIQADRELTLDLNGYTIDRGLSESSAQDKGNVIINNGTLTIMDSVGGGTITGGCTTGRGGGIYTNKGNLTMTGGTITGNRADGGTRQSQGGGVYVGQGTFTMSGGTITGNTSYGDGYGVYVLYDGCFYLSGSPVITGNEMEVYDAHGKAYMKQDNVRLATGAMILINGPLDGASVGVSMNKTGKGVFTTGLGGNGDTSSFFSDNPDYTVALSEEEAAIIRLNEITISDEIVNGTVEASRHGALEGETITLTVTPDPGYELESLAVKDRFNQKVEVENNQFTMPDTSVTVMATFRQFSTIPYLDADGVEQTCELYTLVKADTADWSTGWYAVAGEVALAGPAAVSGDVHLILCDGAVLTASAGISVNEGNELTIYAQSTDSGAGTLNAAGEANNAGIGGKDGTSGGSITINGGQITANGGQWAAGIGGGAGNENLRPSSGTIVINGGTVTANGGQNGAGIGGGNWGSTCSVTINGGTVTATGNDGGAGIGGGFKNTGGSITIHGGQVTANPGSSSLSRGIGGGAQSSDPDVILSWTNLNDFILADSYSDKVTVAEGKWFSTDDDPPLTIPGGEVEDPEVIQGRKLSPYVHEHDLEHFEAVVPTYDPETDTYTNGHTEYWYCAGCDTYYSEDDITTEIAEADTVVPYFSIHDNGSRVRIIKYNGADDVVTIPDTVPDSYPVEELRGKTITSVNQSAFRDNTIITRVVMGDRIQHIGWEAFRRALNLEEITIGSGLQQIDSSAFYDCPSLTKFTCTAAAGSISLSAYPSNMTPPSNIAFYGMHSGSFRNVVENRSFFSTNGSRRYFGLDAHDGPVWTWADDYDSATAAFACSRCNFTSEAMVAGVSFEDLPEEGCRLYTAAVTVDGIEYTDQKTVPLCTVTFDSNGGSEVEAQYVIEGGCVFEPAVPVLDGFNFLGWQKDGAGYVFDTPVTESFTLTALWEKEQLPAVTVNGVSGSFNDRIKLNFYFHIPDAVLADKGAYVTLTNKNANRTVNLPVADAEQVNGRGYKYSILLAAKEAGDTITAKVYDGQGNAVTIRGNLRDTDYTENGVQYSLLQYFTWLESNGTDDEKALGAAAKDYCSAAAIYFGYNTDGLAVSSALDTVTANTLSSYIASREGILPEGVAVRGISAMLESDNTIRLYLGFPEDDPDSFTCTIDGEAAELHRRSDGAYYLALNAGVWSNQLQNAHAYSVSDSKTTYTITASVLTYARSCIIKTDENVVNLGKALFLYNQAAITAFGK